MKNLRHGVSIGLERTGSRFFLVIKAVGKLTHDDYQIMTPLLDSALRSVKQAKVNMLFDASELEGWELRAAWDDFKLGLKHGSEFVKIAIYGNKNWLEKSARVGNWFISGELQYYQNIDNALAWLDE